MEFIGNFNTYDDVVINYPDKGDEFKLEAFYFKNGRLIGFFNMDCPNSTNAVYDAMRNNMLITPDLLRKHGLNVNEIRRQNEELLAFDNDNLIENDFEYKC